MHGRNCGEVEVASKLNYHWYVEKLFTPLAKSITKQFQSLALIMVIDALDECTDREVLKTLQNIILDKKLSNLKLL